MTIEQLNKEIYAEINQLPVGKMGEVILDDELFVNIPDLDAFQEPPPDVIEDAPDEPNDDWVDHIRHVYPFLLGMYIPMRSPGQVLLFGRNLKWFYWSLIGAIRNRVPYATKLDLNAAWSLVLMKTHEHELFHYNINVLQEMFSGKYNPIIEEALAVAWARMRIQEKRSTWHSSIWRMDEMFYSLLMQHAFDYRSAGYRDWVLYADKVSIKSALLCYISPNNFRRLQDNGVDLELLLYNMIGQMDKGYVEQVL